MSEPINLCLVVARFVEFGAAFGLFGFAAFQVYAPAELRGSPGPVYRAVLPVLASLAAIGWSFAIARQICGGCAVSAVALLGRIWLTTGFGRALLAAALLALLLVLVGPGGARRWLGVASSAALLLALSFVGHAAGDGFVAGARIAIKAGHLAAAGAWLGGLPPLALALRHEGPPTLILLKRFGVMGAIAVALVVATGVGSIVFAVAIAGGHLGAVYMRMLTIKLGLVLALLVVAAANRFRLTPMTVRDPSEALAALRKTVLVEQVLGLGILLSVAELGQLDPSM